MSNPAKTPSTSVPFAQIAPGSPIQERIRSWKEQRAREETGVRLKPSLDENEEKKVHMGAKVKNSENLNSSEQAEILWSLYSAISGSGNDEYSRLFISEALGALFSGSDHDNEQISNAFHGAMLGMYPKDIIEAQLCSRLLILHSKAMYFMNKAMNSEYTDVVDLNINRFTKLMRLHNETVETLNRHRRKGEQKVTVQHVNVNKGGQAVVASEFTGGGGNNKNTKE